MLSLPILLAFYWKIEKKIVKYHAEIALDNPADAIICWTDKTTRKEKINNPFRTFYCVVYCWRQWNLLIFPFHIFYVQQVDMVMVTSLSYDSKAPGQTYDLCNYWISFSFCFSWNVWISETKTPCYRSFYCPWCCHTAHMATCPVYQRYVTHTHIYITHATQLRSIHKLQQQIFRSKKK